MCWMRATKFKSSTDAIWTAFAQLMSPHLMLLAFLRGLSFIEHGYMSYNDLNQAKIAIVIVYLIALPYFLNKTYWALRALWKNDYTNEPEKVICLNCHMAFFYDSLKSLTCPKCGGSFENLEGFYERHPELTDNAKR